MLAASSRAVHGRDHDVASDHRVARPRTGGDRVGRRRRRVRRRDRTRQRPAARVEMGLVVGSAASVLALGCCCGRSRSEAACPTKSRSPRRFKTCPSSPDPEPAVLAPGPSPLTTTFLPLPHRHRFDIDSLPMWAVENSGFGVQRVWRQGTVACESPSGHRNATVRGEGVSRLRGPRPSLRHRRPRPRASRSSPSSCTASLGGGRLPSGVRPCESRSRGRGRACASRGHGSRPRASIPASPSPWSRRRRADRPRRAGRTFGSCLTYFCQSSMPATRKPSARTHAPDGIHRWQRRSRRPPVAAASTTSPSRSRRRSPSCATARGRRARALPAAPA